MRILMVSHGYPPIISGVTIVVQKLARAMVRKGHSVTVVSGICRGRGCGEDDEGVQLVQIGGVPNPWWRETKIPYIGHRALQEIVEDVQADILHAHESFFLGHKLAAVGHSLGIPTLASCHYVPRFLAQYAWIRPLQWITERVAWGISIRFLNRVDHVVFATASHRDAFLRSGLETPTTLISNGVDTSRYRPLEAGVRDVDSRLGLPPGPRILFVSRLARDKDIDVLIQAMPEIWASKKAHLLLVGRGDDRDRLAGIVEQEGLEHCVHFLGFVPEEDLPALYNASDLFAMASTCEVQSLPTLQALATGLPVVLADAMALPELVEGGVNGYLVPPRDPEAMAAAILKILRNPDVAGEMGRQGLRVVQPHAEEHTFDLYADLYGRLIATPYS